MVATGVPISKIASTPARQSPRPGRERFLIVRLAGKEFALQARLVCGMMQMRGLPVEDFGGPAGWGHQVELHGCRLPVFTPNRAAGVCSRPVSARTCLLLIESDKDPGHPGFAVQVDSVSRFEDIPIAWVRGNATDGRRVRLGEKWRPVISLSDLAGAFYRWSRDRSATTI